ncbi:MAG: ABC transporter substrate binding protein [Pseudolabrys sp.]
MVGSAVAWPLAAHAQQPAVPVIGFLISGSADSFAIFVDAFKQGMRDHGMAEDRDYLLDLRFANGDYLRFPTFATELVQRKPAVIVVTTISAARAAQSASARIPIVMTGLIDPVGQGLIASLARPGGNTTGLANLAQDVMPKLVEILRATFPTIKVIAVLFNPANPANRELAKAMPAQANAMPRTEKASNCSRTCCRPCDALAYWVTPQILFTPKPCSMRFYERARRREPKYSQ